MNKNETEKRSLMSTDRLNFIIAICAILISAASFYATYLQADAAEKQVRAMTMPIIKFDHGNHDIKTDQQSISFTLKNAGVGPAIIKSVEFTHQNSTSNSLSQFLINCCEKIYREYLRDSKVRDQTSMTEGLVITRSLSNAIVPGQSDYTFLKLNKHDSSEELWNALNETRWKIDLNICFCSMLDDCFVSDRNGRVIEVKACSSVE